MTCNFLFFYCPSTDLIVKSLTSYISSKSKIKSDDIMMGAKTNFFFKVSKACIYSFVNSNGAYLSKKITKRLSDKIEVLNKPPVEPGMSK